MRKMVTLVSVVLLTVLAALVFVTTADARRQGSDFRFDSVVTNAASGLMVIKNAEQDFSLKIISGDGTKNVTIIRLAGSSAEGDIQVLYRLFVTQGEVLGLDW